ncbi:hypothetical protein PWT90_10105 [Aphanocladium album]|nr:hypothetical protein PWT90_10105 [Aphanocladium album]
MGNALSCRSRQPSSWRADTPPPRARQPARESVASKMTPSTTVTTVSATLTQNIDGRFSIFMYGRCHADPLRSHPVQLSPQERRESLEAMSIDEVSIRDDTKSQKRRGMLLINSAAESSFAGSTANSIRLEGEEEDTQVEVVTATTTTVKPSEEACPAQETLQTDGLTSDLEIGQAK